MGIQTKLTAALVFAALPLLLVGLLMAHRINSVDLDLERIFKESAPAITLLGEMEADTHALVARSIELEVLANEPRGAVRRATVARERVEAGQRLALRVEEYGSLPASVERSGLAKRLSGRIETLRALALGPAAGGRVFLAWKARIESEEAALERVLREARAHEQARLRDRGRQIRADVSELAVYIALAGLALGVLILGVAFLVHRNVTWPLARLRGAVDDLGDGNLDVDPNIDSHDEIGNLSRAFRRMAARLRVSTVSRRYVNNILETMDDMLFVVTLQEGLIRTVNASLTRTLGYSTAELLGRPWTMLVPEYGANLDPVVELREMQRNGTLQIEFSTRGGTTIPVKFSVALMQEKDESYIVCTARDITVDRRNETILREARDEARTANRAKSEFLANISHEIRTPLHAILGTADVLAESPLESEDRRHVSNLTRAGETLLRLINEILDISRIEAGVLDVQRERFELAPWFHETCDIHVAAMQRRGLEFLREVTEKTPTYVMADPERLRQVLNNLIGNAMKFTEQGSVRVRVGPGFSMGELYFSVTDTGIGVPPEKRESIFHAFEQADSSITRRFGGTGLGLAISRMLVGRMGGRIWLTSPRGGGSVFHFTIQVPVVVDAPDTRRSETPSPKIPDLSNFRILVAEDNEDNSNLLLAFLKDTHCQIELVRDGRSAVESFQKQAFDLVLLDVQMPIMDGYSAAREMRGWEEGQQRPPTPILALTAHAREADRQRSEEAGCDDHVTKPLRKQVLLSIVESYVKK